jgi:hypothetical protein
MIYASEKAIKIVLFFFLLGFFLLTVYFVGEVKKIEKVYEDIARQMYEL